MSTLYLTEQNSHLRKTSKRLIVESNGETKAEIPAFHINRVVIFGNVQVTTQALDFLLKENIDTAFLSTHGKLYGRLVPTENKNILLRLEQYKRYNDTTFRIEFAKEIVHRKLLNCRRFLQRMSYSRKLNISSTLNQIKTLAEQAKTSTQIDSIRGYEGKGTSYYFQSFGLLLNQFEFKSRVKRPPKDPVNSLLSFGYTLLANEIQSALSAGGIDPYLGFYHEVRYGMASLCFDICEEFRHIIVDALVLDVLNRNQLKHEDFFCDKETEKVLLHPEPRRKFLKAFDQKMSGKTNGEKLGIDYRMVIHQQVEKIRNAIEDKQTYEGYQY